MAPGDGDQPAWSLAGSLQCGPFSGLPLLSHVPLFPPVDLVQICVPTPEDKSSNTMGQRNVPKNAINVQALRWSQSGHASSCSFINIHWDPRSCQCLGADPGCCSKDDHQEGADSCQDRAVTVSPGRFTGPWPWALSQLWENQMLPGSPIPGSNGFWGPFAKV